MKKVNTDIALEYIRKQILAGKLAPGTILNLEQICKETKVSRTPVRDALRVLEAEGLVVIKPRLGTMVKMLNKTEFKELCVVRAALESCAAALAAENRSERDLMEMKETIGMMHALVDGFRDKHLPATEFVELLRLDVKFHYVVLKASGNSTLLDEAMRLQVINRIMIRPRNLAKNIYASDDGKLESEERAESLREHSTVFEAINRGDGLTAEETMKQHINKIPEKFEREYFEDDEMDYSFPLEKYLA